MPEKIDSPSFFEPWLQFKQPIVRQLAFCIASPNILTKIPDDLKIENYFELHSNTVWQERYQDNEVRLQQLDKQPKP